MFMSTAECWEMDRRGAVSAPMGAVSVPKLLSLKGTDDEQEVLTVCVNADLMLGKTEGQRRRGWQGMASPTQWT